MPQVESFPNTQIDAASVLAGLSHALDLTEGHPRGHAERGCAIALRIADVIGLPDKQRGQLVYASLLKDAGCSSNAARVYELFGGSDHDVKRAVWERDWRQPTEQLMYALNWVERGGSVVTKFRRLATLAALGSEGSREIFQIRCTRGAEVARRVGLADDVQRAIHDMDEHWDGGGHPRGLKGDEIPLVARIIGLAQVMEIFWGTDGAHGAIAVAHARSGRWFDPDLVHAVSTFESDHAFWAGLTDASLANRLAGEIPSTEALSLTDASLDNVAEAFALIIDGKSPYTYSHSRRVATYAVGLGRRLGLTEAQLVRLKRAALVHDLGKLTVPNSILDKPAALTDDEWTVMRRHTAFTFDILARVPVFLELALDAASHHEWLNGRGYHRGTSGDALSPEARILAVADVMDALAADRPYRKGLPPERVLAILREGEGTQFAPACLDACSVDLVQGEAA
ncbi:MAG: HD domain-containing protein [Acidobacteria bacterium]|nr:HD domain-containing protein [Acidobacteriota bacterium]